MDLVISLPSITTQWKEIESFKIYKKLQDVQTQPVATCGACFHRIYRERRHIHSIDKSDAKDEDEGSSSSDESDIVIDENEDPMLLTSDPRDWKTQDHYEVLGLANSRWKASPEHIKKAYRKKVLKHHPDKKAATGENDDSFFKCIQKAYEILSDPVKRRQFDSVDDNDEESVPNIKSVSDEEFFSVFSAVFEKEARFSNIQPVPKFGDEQSTKEEVEAFYDFWYSFDSWRTFEYLDKETPETENRDEKRYHEKNNRNERARRKKEDNARLRKLIDTVMKRDVRIARFKQQEKADREAAKLIREEEAKKAREEAARKQEEERLAKEKELEEEKEKTAKAKKEKELKKQQLRKEKKILKSFCQEHDYFETQVSGSTTSMEMILSKLDHYFEAVKELEDVQAFRMMLEKCMESELDEETKKLNAKALFEDQIEMALQAKEQQQVQSPTSDITEDSSFTKKKGPWNEKEVLLLVKAVNMYPGGTLHRWEVIADYISQHSGEGKRDSKDVICKSIEIKKAGGGLPKASGSRSSSSSSEAIQQLCNLQQKVATQYKIKDAPSIRYDQGTVATKSNSEEKTVIWTSENQSCLEKALQTYPPSYKGSDRWDLIAALVPGMSKKDCKLRIKYLAEQVKLRKAKK